LNDPGILTCGDLAVADIDDLLGRYGVVAEWLPPGAPIPGSFWGEPEAGIAGRRVFIRADTPVHSLLHEFSHIVCMRPERRDTLKRNAGSDDLEEAAVCYLQLALADVLPGAGLTRMLADMDAWGYSFRLGSTARWFAEDAADARDWLLAEGLVTADGRPVYRLRGETDAARDRNSTPA